MNRKHSLQEATSKIRRYCAYQERSHSEVRQKLLTLGLSAAEADAVIVDLITSGFLNEERFARTFAGGKFRMKHWGRVKIANALESKGLGANCIRAGLKEIDDETYIKTLGEILRRKSAQLREANPFVRRDKLSKYAIAKGYEPELVWKELGRLIPD